MTQQMKCNNNQSVEKSWYCFLELAVNCTTPRSVIAQAAFVRSLARVRTQPILRNVALSILLKMSPSWSENKNELSHEHAQQTCSGHAVSLRQENV